MVALFTRGLPTQLHTCLSFAGEAANADDPALIPADRCDSVTARKLAGSGQSTYRFHIHSQEKRKLSFSFFFDI